MNKRRTPRRARPSPFRVSREIVYNVERLIGLLLHERFGADGFREAEAYFNKTGGEQCYWEAMTWLAQQTPAVIRAELNLYAQGRRTRLSGPCDQEGRLQSLQYRLRLASRCIAR